MVCRHETTTRPYWFFERLIDCGPAKQTWCVTKLDMGLAEACAAKFVNFVFATKELAVCTAMTVLSVSDRDLLHAPCQ
mgnify:CR=1 FL=1